MGMDTGEDVGRAAVRVKQKARAKARGEVEVKAARFDSLWKINSRLLG
jgi:hypothetical protein